MMQFDNVSILSMAAVDAPHRITSAWIEEQLAEPMQRFGMRPNLIESLTGIKARRFWDPETMPSDAATLAAAKALEQSGLDKNKIGILINTSVCRDYIEPSNAALVHGNLGLPATCYNFDLGNACLAFLNAMEVAGNMIERGQIDYALIVDGESSRLITESTIARLLQPNIDPLTFRNSFASLTLGSGGVAFILCRSSLAPEAPQFLGGVSLAASQHNRLCIGKLDMTEMTTDASGLLVAGVELAGQAYAQAQQSMDWNKKEFAQLILHQVGETHVRKLSEALQLNAERIFKIYPEFGNIGPAAIPITLVKAQEEKNFDKGDRLALLGIGSGLNCAMMEVVW